MSSGQKREVYNTLERLVSSDWNRMQSFIAAHLAEVLRQLYLASANESGGSGTVATTTTPLTAIVMNGLWARPEVGTINLFIEPGVLAMVNPEVSPSTDDSPVKIIIDEGISLGGTLVLTAGAVSTRLDIVEVQRVEETVEFDNRDILNLATKVFTPQNVPKVKRDRLAYRIRVGTAGAGLPAMAAGWLPIMVASVPASATTWDDVTCWDVRPLVSDLVRHSPVTQQFPHRTGWAGKFNEVDQRIAGCVETERGQWRVGGELSPDGVDVTVQTNHQIPFTAAPFVESGFAAVANRPWYLYGTFPGGLPRWSQYSVPAAGARRPVGPKGLLIFTQKAPVDARHREATAINLPPSLGFTGTVTAAAPLVTGAYDGAAAPIDCQVFNGGEVRFGQGEFALNALNGLELTINSGSGTDTITYQLVDNVTHPVGATMVRVKVLTSLILAAAGPLNVERKLSVFNAAGAAAIGMQRRSGFHTITIVGTHSLVITEEWEIPIHVFGALTMPNGLPATRTIQLATDVVGLTVSAWAHTAFVVGWKLGL